MLSYQEIADDLARLVEGELRDRGLRSKVSEDKDAQRSDGWQHKHQNIPFKDDNWDHCLVRLAVKFPKLDRLNWSLDEYRQAFVRHWAKEMAVKLARPFDMTMFNLELPMGHELSVIGRSDNVSLRFIVRYSIEVDLILLWIDALVQWSDK